jgi:spore coat polysaccharide biosynthesis protein SpsF
MGSERFPGKVLRKVRDREMLWYLINRLKQCETLDDIVVGTPSTSENDCIASWCGVHGVNCSRGFEEDVLGRICGSLRLVDGDIGVMVFGDNPLIDPELVDSMVMNFQSRKSVVWLGNDLKTTFPPGMDVEVFHRSAIEDADCRANTPEFREHGTLYIRKHPELYEIVNIEAPAKYSRPELCLGIDTEIDFEVVREIIQHFDGRIDFTLDEIILFLDQNPEIAALNQRVERRWRQYRSD